MNNLMNKTRVASKYWWTSLLIGIFAIILGIWCYMVPLTTLMAMAYVFIAGFFISGVLDIIYSVSERKAYKGWGWILTGGIIDILFSILLIAMPFALLIEMFVYFIGFWVMFRSIWTIGVTLDLGADVGTTWLLFAAILGILFSFMFFLSPIYNGVFVVSLLCLALIFYGVFRIYYAFRLKKINAIEKRIGNNDDQ